MMGRVVVMERSVVDVSAEELGRRIVVVGVVADEGDVEVEVEVGVAVNVDGDSDYCARRRNVAEVNPE